MNIQLLPVTRGEEGAGGDKGPLKKFPPTPGEKKKKTTNNLCTR